MGCEGTVDHRTADTPILIEIQIGIGIGIGFEIGIVPFCQGRVARSRKRAQLSPRSPDRSSSNPTVAK